SGPCQGTGANSGQPAANSEQKRGCGLLAAGHSLSLCRDPPDEVGKFRIFADPEAIGSIAGPQLAGDSGLEAELLRLAQPQRRMDYGPDTAGERDFAEIDG